MQEQVLVDEIIQEVYRRLECKLSKELSKKKLVIVGSIPNSDLKHLEEVYEFTSYKSQSINYEGIIITKLSVDMLGHLAVGSPATEEESFILKALLQEKPVYMLEEGIEYRKYKKNAHKALYTLFMDYEDKIKKYGIRCISHLEELFNEQGTKGELQEVEKIRGNISLDMTYKKLLLESDLIKKHIEGICTVTISKKCIITPLADDYIRKHHIQIEKV